MSREKMLSLTGLEHERAEGRSKEVLDHALAQVGFIPNMYKNMVNQPAVLDTYLYGYSLFRQEGDFTPAEQGVVFLAISHENTCEYCVSAHSMLAANKSGVNGEVIEASRNGASLPDSKLAALDAFTRQMVKTRGNPWREHIDRFLAADYDEKHILSIVLAISVKIISNYSNHLFNTEIDDVFAPFAWPD